jgi:hypothetical protein
MQKTDLFGGSFFLPLWEQIWNKQKNQELRVKLPDTLILSHSTRIFNSIIRFYVNYMNDSEVGKLLEKPSLIWYDISIRE